MPTYTNQQNYAASPEQIWSAITNPADFTWRSNVKSANVLSPNSYNEVSSQTGYATEYKIVREQKHVRRNILRI